MLIRTQDMNEIIDAVHVYHSFKEILGYSIKGEAGQLLGKYNSNEEAIQVLDALEDWLNNGNRGVFRMPLY